MHDDDGVVIQVRIHCVEEHWEVTIQGGWKTEDNIAILVAVIVSFWRGINWGMLMVNLRAILQIRREYPENMDGKGERRRPASQEGCEYSP